MTLYSKKGNELSHKNIHDVIFRIINIADGNPGIAMSMWLSFIKYDNERFYMELNKTYEDVEIENTNWLSLLQRLMIFGNISKEEFKYEQGDFIQRNIKLLEKTGLVTPIRKDSYKIDEFLKPFVERWLKNKEII
ncbi:MAG TPA: hypothetical protein ENK75_00065 [Saprospiraceae bacterium]|nr:hypothetical protein [Saprospiraceae bacterium]